MTHPITTPVLLTVRGRVASPSLDAARTLHN
jgi:hypothetical protein